MLESDFNFNPFRSPAHRQARQIMCSCARLVRRVLMYINCETKRGFMLTALGPEFSAFMNITIQPPLRM